MLMMEPSKEPIAWFRCGQTIRPVTGEAAAEDGDGKEESEEQSKNCEDEGEGRLGLLFNLTYFLFSGKSLFFCYY